MKRNLYKIQDVFFDLEYINCIKSLDDKPIISVLYNNTEMQFEFKDISERNSEYKKIVNELSKSKMTLLYDNDRDIINYSNVIYFSEPEYKEDKMSFTFGFKTGDSYTSTIYYNEVGETKETSKEKMKIVYNELFELWKKNEPCFHKPFHKIDLDGF